MQLRSFSIHFIKRTKCGYKQAELLAQRVGEILNIPVEPTLNRKFPIYSPKIEDVDEID